MDFQWAYDKDNSDPASRKKGDGERQCELGTASRWLVHRRLSTSSGGRCTGRHKLRHSKARPHTEHPAGPANSNHWPEFQCFTYQMSTVCASRRDWSRRRSSAR